ncbi:hypothetical protein [Bradyrhizobium sp. 190]|uniref:hypothetical protein n=1 Tax=Bradyrhizobium sp. 190 TaxID=2782658 RepID=UPI001FF8A88F|nr:hypothetical protein [Bradyrhizobium sp. 190]
MTMLNRSAPDAPPTLALTATEIGVLDRLVNDKPKSKTEHALGLSDQDRPARRLSSPHQRSAARQYRYGRGLSRLSAIGLGAIVGGEFVGN